MRDKIIELLGRGISATQVAAAVGCDDSYVSQLMSDEEVHQQVTQLRATYFAEFAEQDQKLDDAEAEALKRVASLVPFITKPTEAARVYGILNAAKRRTAGAQQTAAPQRTVVLDLPEAARVSFTMTEDRQVIQIGQRSMVTMPAKSLQRQLEERNAQRLLETKIPQTLPLMNASQQQIEDVRLRTSKATTPLSEQL